MRAIPLLLCWVSGSVGAAGLPALVVSPDLVRTPRVAAPPSVTPASAMPGQPLPAAVAAPAPVPVAPPAPLQPATAGPEPAPAVPAAQTAAAGKDSTEVSALRIRGTRAVELVADGEAALQRGDLTLTADRLTYRELSDEAVAEGNVRLAQGQDEVTGPAARIVVGERTGEFETPRYAITRSPAPGSDGKQITGSGGADMLHFEGENQYRLRNATWTSCSAQDPDWYIKAQDLQLDYDNEIGTVRHGTVVFKDTPILWLPWAEFPLVGQRQSGLLAPTVGTSNKTGLDITQPYYWNIAPNYDATLAPRFMSRRGLQLGGEFRYLQPGYAGELRGEWMGRDRLAGESRYLGSLQHHHLITPRLHASLDLNAVSDDEYFEDLSSRLAVASKVNLLREGRLHYQGADWWRVSALWQRYQTLSSERLETPQIEPYRRLPELNFDAARADLPWGATFDMKAQYTEFDHPDKDRIGSLEGVVYRPYAAGSRLVLNPQLALPIERGGYFITPRIGVHHTRYELDDAYLVEGGRTSINRTVPVFSLDGGLNFEREARFFGQDYVQTLEPRLFYVRSPERYQDDIPLFDTFRYDFSFAQMFSASPYSGHDRVADANQVTLALTSRLIDPQTGAERLYGAIGQRHYFSDQKVALPGEALRQDRRTDILAALGGQVTAHTWLNSAWQYDPRDGRTERFNIGARWQPGFARAVNMSYRWTRDVLRDIDVSAQWPLGGRWYGVGRLTRSIKENRITEAIAGLEYDGGCWVFRTVAHRFATTEKDVTQALFFQLELNGLASIGSNPVSLLQRSVSGYGKINEPGSGRIFGAE